MALGAFTDGLRRVAAAPLLFLGVYTVSVSVALPLALVLRDAGATRSGPNTITTFHAGSPAASWAAFRAETTGIARTVGPGGLTTIVTNPGHLASDRPPHTVPAGLAAACAAVWTFLAGGVLDRLARQRRVGNTGFLAAGRHHFWPLARLAVLAGTTYWFLFGVLAPRVFTVFAAPTRGQTIDPDTALVRFALYGLFGAGGAAVGLILDYARVRAVVEDRRSVIGALRAALRFVRRRPAAVAGLWLLNTALLALVLTGCALVTPVATGVGATPWGPFPAGQICVAARLFTTLAAWASQTAYFQSQLAHPTYVARDRQQRPEPSEPISGRPA